MVGEPKHLSDLQRMQAHLWVQCRACGSTRTLNPGQLMTELVARNASLVWSELPRGIPCRCGSTSLKLRPAPIGTAPAGGNKVDARQRLVTIALEVLKPAAFASRTQRTDTLEVRLAVAALWLILRDRQALRDYWDRAQRAAEVAWDTNHRNYGRITATLRSEGWEAPING